MNDSEAYQPLKKIKTTGLYLGSRGDGWSGLIGLFKVECLMEKIFVKDDFRFKLRQLGKGIPLISIGSVDFYSKCFDPEFLETFSLTLFDHRGYAGTDKAFRESDFSMDILIDDMLFMMNEMQINFPFYLLGHSAHTYFNIALLQKLPEKLRLLLKGIIMVTSAPNSFKSFEASMVRWNNLNDSARKASDLEYQSKFLSPEKLSFVNFCKAYHSRSWHDFTVDHNWVWDSIEYNDRALDYIYRSIFPQLDLRGLAKLINVPVLNISGNSDYLVPPQSEWHTEVDTGPLWTFSSLEGVGHYPFLENPNEFKRVIEQWFKKI